MIRYIAVDSGKQNTKVSEYYEGKDEIKSERFPTKIGKGTFEDDQMQRKTSVMSFNGKTYCIGSGGTVRAEHKTSKQSEVHLLTTLCAVAQRCSDNEEDEVNIALGIPASEWAIVEKRNALRDYLLPSGTIEVDIKTSSNDTVHHKKFHFATRKVYAESEGALFLDDSQIVGYSKKQAAVIDIGGLNVNCTIWNELELDTEDSLTDELGGQNLIRKISQRLSAEFSRVNEKDVLRILKESEKDIENRCLTARHGNEDVKTRSREIIHDEIIKHLEQIKSQCDAKQWSLDYIDLIFIGGTSGMLRNEIQEVFGNDVIIPPFPEFSNVLGFLHLLYACCQGKSIDLTGKLKASEKRKANKESIEKKEQVA